MGSLHDLIQFIFAGLTGGAIYALVALGFGVVHNTMGIVNFTQVDFVSLGGMILYSALVTAGLPMAPALLAAVARGDPGGHPGGGGGRPARPAPKATWC